MKHYRTVLAVVTIDEHDPRSSEQLEAEITGHLSLACSPTAHDQGVEFLSVSDGITRPALKAGADPSSWASFHANGDENRRRCGMVDEATVVADTCDECGKRHHGSCAEASS